MTDFLPNSRSAGNCSDRGTSVRPKTKWKTSVCGSSFASARHCARLAAREAAGAVERDVGLGVQRVALEDDEPCVDAAAPERLGRRPRDAGRVDRAERDAQRPAGGVLRAGVGARRAGVAGALRAGVGGASRRRRVVGAERCVGAGGAHRWRNRRPPGTIPALTRDTRRGTVPVPPGGWGLGMG